MNGACQCNGLRSSLCVLEHSLFIYSDENLFGLDIDSHLLYAFSLPSKLDTYDLKSLVDIFLDFVGFVGGEDNYYWGPVFRIE